MEEIGALFGDEHVASHWYGISEDEKQQIAENALRLTKSGRIPDGPQLESPADTPKHDTEKHETTSA